LASGALLGQIDFTTNVGSSISTGASIKANCDGTAGSGDAPTRLVFSTTADGASSPTERLRIDSNGDVKLGGTLPSSPNISLNADGSATFASYVESDLFSVSRSAVANKDNYVSKLPVNDTGKHFNAKDAGGTSIASINADGSAVFKSGVFGRTLSSTNASTNVDASAFEVYQADYGSQNSTNLKAKWANTGDIYIGGVLTGAGRAPNISLNADGSASFAGKVTSASTADTDADTTLVTKDYVDANAGGSSGDIHAWGSINNNGTKAYGSNNWTSVWKNTGGRDSYVVTLSSGISNAIIIANVGDAWPFIGRRLSDTEYEIHISGNRQVGASFMIIN